MNVKKIALVLASVGALTLGVAACSQPTPPPASEKAAVGDAPMSAMPMPATATTGTVSATGVVSAIDTAAGTVTIDHGPIAAISWPAMNMQFHAENPQILNGIAVGDHVAFELKSAADTGTVTMVHKQ
jgi:Cu/Ag efflux protein CusF